MDENIPVTEARAQFSELVNRVGFGKERIILTRHGKPLVALVPAEMLTPAAGDGAEERLTVLDLSSRAAGAPAADYSLAAEDRTSPPQT